MALKAVAIDLIAPYIKGDVLCLSYPDILIPWHVVEDSGITVTRTTQHGKRHGISEPIPETTEFLRQFGADSVRYVDVVRFRGVEEIVDLNEPQELGQYDLVIDPGTLEHCFNVAQAVVNASKAVKVGGHIFHSNPMTMLNHGFWNFNPTMWHDFYLANGFQVIAMAAETGELSKIKAVERFRGPQEASLYCLARKVRECPVRWPTQSKYKASLQRYQQVLDAVTRKQPKVIAEIGTWNGVRALQMLQRAPDATYYGFDVFEHADDALREEEFSHKKPTTEADVRAKLDGYRVNLIVGNTRETLRDFKPHAPIDFLWLDGGHSVETIRSDWELIKPHLAKDAEVYFDDYFLDGPDTDKFGCNRVVESLPHEVLPMMDTVVGGGTTQIVRVLNHW